MSNCVGSEEYERFVAGLAWEVRKCCKGFVWPITVHVRTSSFHYSQSKRVFFTPTRWTCPNTLDFWVDWRGICQLVPRPRTTVHLLLKWCFMYLPGCLCLLITRNSTERSADNVYLSTYSFYWLLKAEGTKNVHQIYSDYSSTRADLVASSVEGFPSLLWTTVSC